MKRKKIQMASVLLAFILIGAIFVSAVGAENQIVLNEKYKPDFPRYIERFDLNQSEDISPERDFVVHMEADITANGRYIIWESETVTIPLTTLPYMYAGAGLYRSSDGETNWQLKGTAVHSGTWKSSVHAIGMTTVPEGGYYRTLGIHSFNGPDGTPYGPYQTQSDIVYVS
ncbi:MAG: hypothetical protein WC164_04115 [Patescibacteria group bacterium]|jgi:hypothetical protein|nr:hypothetical protein [Methanoregulaceae archaeon]HOP08552.1 hypothetical protein [candidate division Zixibacteria bacterium]